MSYVVYRIYSHNANQAQPADQQCAVTAAAMYWIHEQPRLLEVVLECLCSIRIASCGGQFVDTHLFPTHWLCPAPVPAPLDRKLRCEAVSGQSPPCGCVMHAQGVRFPWPLACYRNLLSTPLAKALGQELLNREKHLSRSRTLKMLLVEQEAQRFLACRRTSAIGISFGSRG